MATGQTNQHRSATNAAFSVGQKVLWHSSKGYTPRAGEIGVIDRIWLDQKCVRLTLPAPDAPPEFGGLCSMIARFDEIQADAPHSWQIEDHEPEDLRQPDELAADDAGVREGDFA